MNHNLSAIDTRLAGAYQKRLVLEGLRTEALAFVADGDRRMQTAASHLSERIAGLDFAINHLLECRGQLDPEVRALLGLPEDATDEELKQAIQQLVALVKQGGDVTEHKEGV